MKGQREQRTVSKETKQRQELLGPTSARAATTISTPAIHPLDSLSITGPTRDVARKVFKVAISMKTDLAKRDSTKYCEFHKDHRHRTDDCIQMMKEIEYLIRRGHLLHFVASEGRGQAPLPSPRQSAPAQYQ